MGLHFLKDPSSVLDYKFDWSALTNGSGLSDWLASDETISSYTITVPAGITVDGDSKTDTNTSVTVWLSSGTAGVDYTIECKIVTSASRTDTRSFVIMCRDR